MEHKIINRDIESLIFAEYNPRQLTKDQYKHLKDSIDRFGLVDPIIVNINKQRENIIIGGHQRVKVAKDMNIKEVPVIELDLTYDRERELNVRLNANTGEWDTDILANMFELDELQDWGFDDIDLKLFEDEEIKEGLTDDDDVPEVEESVCKAGDLWLLGEHRLLCGDATKKEDVELLMDGNKADLTITSPPYNVGKTIRGNLYKNDLDNKSNDQYTNFLLKSSDLCVKYSNYIFWNIQLLESNKISLINFQTLRTNTIKDILIWNKSQYPPHINKGTFGTKWEYVFVFSKESKSRQFPASWQGKYSNVIETESNSANKFADNHKAGFPVSFPLWIIEKMDFSNSVLDPFIGSGTTLIACEKTARKCYGRELDPHYCDVIIKRWEDYTGKVAKLDGKT